MYAYELNKDKGELVKMSLEFLNSGYLISGLVKFKTFEVGKTSEVVKKDSEVHQKFRNRCCETSRAITARKFFVLCSSLEKISTQVC